jgi:hypothetical protein
MKKSPARALGSGWASSFMQRGSGLHQGCELNAFKGHSFQPCICTLTDSGTHYNALALMPSPRLITPQDIETLRTMAEAGASCQRTAVGLKRTMSTIRNLAHQHGIKLKKQTELRRSFGLSRPAPRK